MPIFHRSYGIGGKPPLLYFIRDHKSPERAKYIGPEGAEYDSPEGAEYICPEGAEYICPGGAEPDLLHVFLNSKTHNNQY